MAQARQASSPVPETPVPSPRPSSPEDTAPPPLPEARATDAPGTPPAPTLPVQVAYGRLLANGALLLILVSEGGVLVMSSTWMNRLTGAFALFAGVLALAQIIFNLVFQFVSDEFKARTRTLLQSPRLTLILGIIVLLFAGPSVLAARQILSPPPLLQILPAPGTVFNSFPQATGEGDDYFLEVRQDGKLLSTVKVTGKGSIVVGQNGKVRMENLADKLKEAQNEEMDKKTIKLNPDIKNKWKDSTARAFSEVALRKGGCVRLDLTDPKDAGRPVISRRSVRLDSNPQLIFLEDKLENPGCGS